MDDRLYRSVDDRMLAGVAGGVAERLDADPSIIRVVWALLIVLTGGIALIAYLVMAIVVPEDPGPEARQPFVDPDQTTETPTASGSAAAAAGAGAPAGAADTGGWIAPDGRTVSRAEARRTARRERRANRRDDRGAFIGGLVLILLGGFFLLRQFVPAIDLGSWWPVVLVGIGVVLVLVSVMPGRRPD